MTTNIPRSARQWRFNPLPSLTSAALARHLDDFRSGQFRAAANIFELLEERDDLLRGVISKRKKSVARHGWTVLPVPNLSSGDAAAARAQVEALEYFYNHVETENALDSAERGGFKLLARQMMDAVGKRFAVHEMVWRKAAPSEGVGGGFVSATFRFVPLGFFENQTGELRYLSTPSATEGAALEPGAWMITVGEGLMIASATAWMFKNLSLNDWLNSCERNGTPALLAKSPAAVGSAEWNALAGALEEIVENRSAIHGTADEIRVLDLLGSNRLPYPELVERIDRLLASLWRGADLSTLSRDRGYGASLQEKETCALEEDDAEMIGETLNRYVDPWVIRHVFGPDAPQLARVKVLVAPRECTAGDLQVDEFLLRHGAPLALQTTLSRYGRALPAPGEPLLRPAAASDPRLPANSHLPSPGAVDNQAGALLPAPEVSSREPSAEAALANRFVLLQEDWVQLSPYGDFPHARGLQRIDRAAAEAMVAQFGGFLARAGRLFGGVPFYIGHPDLPDASELADRKAYGWVVELAARDDGFYGRVKWSEAGLGLLRNGHYKFLSPFWEARADGQENGRPLYRPAALLSVGLTNQPNLPVRPLANEEAAAAAVAAPAPAPLPLSHTRSVLGPIGARRSELAGPTSRRDRIQERVRAKLQLGLPYDEAWETVKREHRSLFAND